MAELRRVTVTGADDTTPVKWMVEIQRQYPFVEWGVLVSSSAAVRPRFPSLRWQHQLAARANELQLSLHVCGKWVRQLCSGETKDFLDYQKWWLPLMGRCQLNISHYLKMLTPDHMPAVSKLKKRFDLQVIYQLHKEQDLAVVAETVKQVRAAVFFDGSGGRGISPENWPVISADWEYGEVGFGGGIGCDNVETQLTAIERGLPDRNDLWFWIDAESRLRSEDGQSLDPALVEGYLEQASIWIS